MYSTAKREKIVKYADATSINAAADHFGLSRETVRREVRRYNNMNQPKESVFEPNSILAKIQEKYSDKELELLAKGGIPLEYKHTAVHDFDGEVIKIGYMSDLHIGSVYTNYDYFADARREFADAGVDMVVIAGDVTEGMSNRPGHIYECTELGYERQRDKAVELLGQFDFCPVYMIDGNHDRWYIKSNGAMIVKDICDRLPMAEFLGHDEGDINIGNVTIKLWHGEDGSSYAHSYRIQKLVESWQGGDKPNVLFCGHVHKRINMIERNIHCISAGCIQKQSKWMRGKRLPAHTGFGIAEFTVNERGVGKFTDTWFPLYV